MAYRAKENKQNSRADLQPPQSLETEQSVLGAILKDANAVNEVIEVIDDETCFYSPRHRKIFRAILDLYGRNEPCDITIVADELLKQNQLEEVGGRTYLVELVEGVVTTANVAAHAGIVLEKALARRLISTSNDIIGSCYAMELPVENLLDEAESAIFRLSESRHRQGFVPIKSLISSAIQQIEDFQSDEGPADGVKSGFPDLDGITQGLRNGDLIVIAGRPSMGKSSLAMNIAESVAIDQKRGAAIFSVEMSSLQVGMRLLCSRARMNQHKLRVGKLSSGDWANLTHHSGILSGANIFIDDSATLSSLEVRAKARRLKAQQDIGVIIVDYIQMMAASGRHENRQQEIAVISRGLKALAKELDVPVIAVSQLSRMVETRGGEKRPQLSDLRESGAIEQDADVVMFVYRPEFYFSHLERNDPKYLEVEGKAEILIAKQRNGPTGVVNLTFVKDYARFESPAPSHREIPDDVEPVGDAPDVPF
jgi:replicative DNA helicase